MIMFSPTGEFTFHYYVRLWHGRMVNMGSNKHTTCPTDLTEMVYDAYM